VAIIAAFRRMVRGNEFDICEMAITTYICAKEFGKPMTAVPIFIVRAFHHGAILANTKAGIRKPTDLEGKRVGSRTYRTALTVWARGLLRERYGVDFSKVQWVLQAKEVFPVHDPNLKITYVDESKNMAQRLIAGELDAILTDISDSKLFETLENHPKIKRLFPGYLKEDEQLYRETGIFTPVHMIVMSRKLDTERPELAARFYTAFEKAKQIAYDDILSDRGGFSIVYLRERMKEQTAAWGDPWRYGIEANKATIATFIRYNLEQGMIRSTPSYRDIFAGGTLDT